MSIVSQKLRDSAGHPDAYCSNRQKTLHAAPPETVPRGREAKQCACGVWFSLPACHAARHKSCTAACAEQRRKVVAESRKRACEECGSRFAPRPNQVARGHGRYCSIGCALVVVRRTPEFAEAVRRGATNRNYQPKTGPENPLWKGGQKAYIQRRIESGDAARALRAYRNANPHKTREWQQNRKNRKAGRLEYGTVPALMEAQKGRCANCLCNIRDKYHVDHIVPLSKGGRHEAGNVQLLCGPCNLQKSDRDPIVFAQMNGRLL